MGHMHKRCFIRLRLLVQLLRDELNQFRELAVYVRDGFSAYRQQSYECGCCEVTVARNFRSSHNFYAFGVHQI